MKKIGEIVTMMVLMCMSVVSATVPTTGFHLDNLIDVTGDWVYNGGWTLPSPAPVTAQFNMAIDSNTATAAQFSEIGKFGTQWHLDYDSFALVNAPVKFENTLNAITVNPPGITPGDSWTKVHFVETTFSDFSASQLSVNGYGDVFVSSKYVLDNKGNQTIDLNIN